MGYERYPRGTNPQGDYYNRTDPQDYGTDYGSGRSYSYSSARDYEAAGYYDRDRNDRDRGRSGPRDDGNRAPGYGQQGQQYGQARYAQGDEYHGSYASDGRRWEDVGARRNWDDDNRDRTRPQDRDQPRGRDYGRAPQGYDYQDRGFISRAGDEVRSWFGDEDAERRREADSRHDERHHQPGSHHRDADYHSWRSGQIAALDRDYDEYRREHRSKFENEFSSWRSNRQTQRDSLNTVKEHAEVVGSDGTHVGTVDKVRGDRILLTKNDADAGEQHHSIPSSWIATADDKKVTLTKSADEAKRQWRDEEQNQALFGDHEKGRDEQRGGQQQGRATSATDDNGRGLNRSFSGTY